MAVRAWAPGRVNLIGDHTDYTGGLCLPLAIGLGVEVRGEPGGSWVMLESAQDSGLAEIPLSVDDPAAVEPPWARYVAGVVAELKPADGIIGTIDSTVPIGVGLASSAALEVAVATALGANLDDPVTVAQACQRGEQRAVGVPCGIMDQLTACAAVLNTALRIDCRSLEIELVRMPDDVEVVVVDSGRRRELVNSPYAQRGEECARIEALIGPLRDATLETVDTIEDPVLRRRARHVVTENERVDAAVAALGEADVHLTGELMAASHASLHDDYEVSTPELDALVAELVDIRGVFGARLTGAGFGGCAVALCDPYTVFDFPVVWRGLPAAGARLSVE